MNELKRFLLSFMLMFVCTTLVYAQTEITGTVLDETGETVIGASVVEKGTSNGTVTDFDGNFVIKVNPGATLVISYIGYDKMEVAAEPGMTITLKDNAVELKELVVVGYQVQRKADLTGAVAVMDMKGPISESDPNMLNSMQGKLSGVDIVTDAAPGGGSSTIRVRGMSTVNACDPLYVIDGVATNENLNSLNSADIESIQVLKDASSASIYGSRAANGVIIITTKKGKEGRMAINVNYNAALQTVVKKFDMLSADQWGQAYWQAAHNDGIAPTAASALYGTGATPQLVSSVNGIATADTDWQKAVYSSAWTHNISASISNANEKGSYLFSGNYINQNGLMDRTFYKRLSARVNSTYNFNQYVRVGENLMIAKWDNRGADTNGDRGIPYSAMRQHPAIPIYSASGVFADPVAMLGSDIDNPVQTLYNARDNQNTSWRIFGNAYVDIMPIKGLTLKSNIGIEHVQFLNKTLTRNVRPSDISSNRAVNRNYGQGDTWTWTNTANYLLDINGVHHLTFLAGTEAIKYVYEDLGATRKDYAFEDVDYMQIGAGSGTMTNGGGKQEWALFSLFGKVDYNYADRYLFSATLRRDQTSRLSSKHNSGIFPAFSAAWRISEEKFWVQNPIIGNVKLRAAWGQNGNSAIFNNYAAYSTYVYDIGNGAYDLNGTNTGVVSGIKVLTTGNPDLKWETTTQTNIGIDAYLFNNKISLSADYYWKDTKDMITIPPVLSVAGENAAKFVNTGEMKNHGFELNLGYHSPLYGDFSWDATYNFSMYRNKLVKYNDKVSVIGGDFRLIEGQPMGVYYGYVADGIFQDADQVSNHAIQEGKGIGRMIFRDINGDGVVDDGDRCIIGDPNPDFAMGLNLGLYYKNWSLAAFFAGEFGFDIYNGTRKQLEFMTYGNLYTNRGKDVLNAWTTENTGASIPALTTIDDNNEMRMSTYFVEDGSYFKCKYIKLGYRFDQPWLQTLGMTALNIYGQVENVFTMTKYKGLDPEVPLGVYGARIDNGPYPRARTFSLGLNLSF
ncbi:MAG: TonB-dependent receptor [Muribaculaceae bacterium]|nr:TonB-dependent receptor [Muribaculaceae bacterium]